MGNLITYDGTNPFLTQVDPLVSKSTEYIQAGERWGTLESITLDGTITGANFTDLYSSQTSLLNAFSEDFKTLSISNFNDFNRCKLGDISFGNTDYLTYVDYSITLNSFGEESSRLKAAGVIDPVSKISYSDEGDGKVSATREVSAKGISIPGKTNALQNAVSFVEGLAGQSRPAGSSPGDDNWVSPPSLAGKGAKNPNMPMTMKSQRQNINRITCEVSLTETYEMDPNEETEECSVLKYRTTIAKNSNQITTTTIEGSLESSELCDPPLSMDDLFARFDAFKAGYNSNTSRTTFTQDLINKKLSFSFEFTEGADEELDIDLDINVSLSEGSSSNIITVSVSGTVRSLNHTPNVGGTETDVGEASPAFKRVQQYFSELDFYQHALEIYNDYKSFVPSWNTETTLNTNPVSQQTTESAQNASISFNVSFDDRYDTPTTTDQGNCQDVPSSVSITAYPQYEVVSIVPTSEGSIKFVNGYTTFARVDMAVTQTSDSPISSNVIDSIKKAFNVPLQSQGDGQAAQPGNSSSSNEKQQRYSTSMEFKSENTLSDHASDGEYNGGQITI